MHSNRGGAAAGAAGAVGGVGHTGHTGRQAGGQAGPRCPRTRSPRMIADDCRDSGDGRKLTFRIRSLGGGRGGQIFPALRLPPPLLLSCDYSSRTGDAGQEEHDALKHTCNLENDCALHAAIRGDRNCLQCTEQGRAGQCSAGQAGAVMSPACLAGIVKV